MSLITCGSLNQGHECFSDDFQGKQEIFVFAALLCEQFYQFPNIGAKMLIKS